MVNDLLGIIASIFNIIAVIGSAIWKYFHPSDIHDYFKYSIILLAILAIYHLCLKKIFLVLEPIIVFLVWWHRLPGRKITLIWKISRQNKDFFDYIEVVKDITDLNTKAIGIYFLYKDPIIMIIRQDMNDNIFIGQVEKYFVEGLDKLKDLNIINGRIEYIDHGTLLIRVYFNPNFLGNERKSFHFNDPAIIKWYEEQRDNFYNKYK